MAAFFESTLLFSLAVLIVLVGLLVYYFKDRLADIKNKLDDLEQKNIKCLEIINDVYVSHLDLKNSVNQMQLHTVSGGNSSYMQPINMHIKEWSNDNYHEDQEKVHEESEDSEDSEDSDFKPDFTQIDDGGEQIQFDMYDNSTTKKIKINLFDLDPIECIDISDNDEDEVDLQSKSLENYDVVIDYENMQFQGPDAGSNTIIQKTENIIELENEKNLSQVIDEKRDYKKMTLPELRGYIISIGIQSDSNKLKTMKKNELIELILASETD